jgi:hypothetical protein
MDNIEIVNDSCGRNGTYVYKKPNKTLTKTDYIKTDDGTYVNKNHILSISPSSVDLCFYVSSALSKNRVCRNVSKESYNAVKELIGEV